MNRETPAVKQEGVAALEALWTEGQGAGGDTRESAPNWARPAAAASLRNTAPRSKASVFRGLKSPDNEIVGWSSFDFVFKERVFRWD